MPYTLLPCASARKWYARVVTIAEPTSGTSAWGALLKVHAAVVPVVDAELRRQCGIPLSWYDILLELNGAPNRKLTMGELTDRVVLSRTRISRVVDDLVAAGLVERRSHPTDRRSAYAALTGPGRQVLRRAAPVYLASIERHFSAHLSPTEIEAIATGLWRVRDAST